MPSDLLLKNCAAVTGAEPRVAGGPVDIVIRGGRIDTVAPAGTVESAAGEVIDATGLLAAPGLINGHCHSGEHFHKGRLENLPLEMFMTHVRPLRPATLSGRQMYLRTMVGAIEALRTGSTTLVDDLNQHLTGAQREAVFRAYEDIGIRALVSSSMADIHFLRSVPFLEQEMDRDLLRRIDAQVLPRPETLLDVCRELARHRHPRDHRVGYVVAPSAPQRCSDTFLRAAREIADEFDLPVIIHAQESRMQVVHGRQLYGMTMIEHLDRLGFLKPGTSLIHAVWLTPAEIETIARSGATVQHNPWSNLLLGSGVAPLSELLAAGVNVSLGSDGCASTHTLNMHIVMGTAAGIGKVRGTDPGTWPTADDVFRAATRGGAKGLGRAGDLGAVAPGYLADIVLYRLDSPAFVPLGDPIRQLVYGERGAAIDTVIVAGDVVMRARRLTRIDEAALAREAQDACDRLAAELDASLVTAATLAETYERIYRRTLAIDIDDACVPARLA